MRTNLFKYGLTALMMAFAMILCYSCSSDDDEETNQEVDPPSNREFPISGTINGHGYVELAGYKWATENVGVADGVKELGKDDTYGYYYNYENAIAAAASWGGDWALPTKEQWIALIKNCKWELYNYVWYMGKGMEGYIVSDMNDQSKCIFLPSAGHCEWGSVQAPGQDQALYWSSTPAPSYLWAYGVHGDHIFQFMRDEGYPVRLVSK